MGDRILVAGGLRLDSTEVFSRDSGVWSDTAALSSVRGGLACGVVNGRVMVVGGRRAANTPLSSVESWDPGVGTWVRVHQ